MASPQTIPILERAAELMAAVAQSPSGLSAKQLNLQLGIPQATCYRMLRTLVGCGWLQEGAAGQYRPAYGLARLARPWFDLESRLRAVKPQLEALAESTGLSAKISLLEGGHAVIVMRSQTRRPFSIVSPVGSRIALAEAGSAGVMLLAVMAPPERDKALAKVEAAAKRRLLQLAETARKERMARAYGTFHPAIHAVSVALESEVPTVLSVIGWPEDFAGTGRKKIEAKLRKCRPAFRLDG